MFWADTMTLPRTWGSLLLASDSCQMNLKEAIEDLPMEKLSHQCWGPELLTKLPCFETQWTSTMLQCIKKKCTLSVKENL